MYAFGALAVVVYTLCIFVAGLISAEKEITTSERIIDGSTQLLATTRNSIRSLSSTPETIHIDIAHKHFQKLAYKRELAKRIGLLESSDDDYVPAVIRHNAKHYDVKLRLKGDAVDHLEGDKWSYRVKVKDDKALFGMRTFSIQHPKTRNYLAEWVFHQALRREQIASLRYDFINVSVNGKNLGIFALEEHFNKILIEDNQRRQGPIIRFSEDQVWNQGNLFLDFPQAFSASSSTYHSVIIDAFEGKAIASDSLYTDQFLHAVSLLESFRKGEQRARDVFDLDKLAKYLAISELLGAHHSLLWHQMRFYFNPITARLEPIAFDGNTGDLLLKVTAAMDLEAARHWRREVFITASEDPLFLHLYHNALYSVSQPEYLSNLLESLKPEFDKKLQIIHKSFPAYAFPFDILEKNRSLLYSTINPEDGLRTHFIENKRDTISLEVGSTQSLPVSLHSIQLGAHSVSLQETPLLPGRQPHQNIIFKQISFPLPDTLIFNDSTLATYHINYKIPGSDSLLSGPIMPTPHSDQKYITHAIPRDSSTVDAFPFLIQDEESKTISVMPGTWIVDQSIIIPETYSLNISEGTSFDLIKSAAILVHGPVQFHGSSNAPIEFTSSDTTGQGLTVLNAKESSHIKHTSFVNQQHLHHPGWTLTGSINFYESDVFLNNVRFADNLSEDALNIIRSSFQMDSVSFSNTFSDAFDGDFIDGEITNSTFAYAGNDAIDVSGSTLKFNNVRVYQAGDKALSAGEYSKVEGVHLEVIESNIGVASKDNSIVSLDTVLITGSQIGVALYQKKPEFGPGSLEINGLVLKDTQVPSLVEEGSLLLMNSERIRGDLKQVATLLY